LGRIAANETGVAACGRPINNRPQVGNLPHITAAGGCILPNYGEAHGNLAGVLDFEHDLKQALSLPLTGGLPALRSGRHA
jgi:hypothetical protein